MDNKLYPSGVQSIEDSDIVTSLTTTDHVMLLRGKVLQKAITVANFLGGLGTAVATKLTTTGLFLAETELTVTGDISADVSLVALNHSSVKIEATIAAPAAGRFLVIYQKDTGTAAHTVTITSGTWDGSATIATFDAQDETLVVYGISATRFVVVENIGTIVLS